VERRGGMEDWIRKNGEDRKTFEDGSKLWLGLSLGLGLGGVVLAQ
jgi:hypothetical protein